MVIKQSHHSDIKEKGNNKYTALQQQLRNGMEDDIFL